MRGLLTENERMANETTVWVLTREINEYDQHGEYFVAVFGSKPPPRLLRDNGVPRVALRHVLNGGGRISDEYEWFYLRATPISQRFLRS